MANHRDAAATPGRAPATAERHRLQSGRRAALRQRARGERAASAVAYNRAMRPCREDHLQRAAPRLRRGGDRAEQARYQGVRLMRRALPLAT